MTSSTYPNPLLRASAADPCVLRNDDRLYMYSSGSAPGRGIFAIYSSPVTDRTSWTLVGAVFNTENAPAWAMRRSYWAPEVHRIQERYVCYFSMRDQQGHFHIGAATAPSPAGPFTAQPGPLASDPRVGLIDPTWFKDPVSGRTFLIWKEDANDLKPQEPTGLILQEVEADGLTLKGKTVRLLENDQPWEGPLVEGPSLIYRAPYYYLFYSGNLYANETYGVGVARSRNVEGPYEKFAGNPILRSSRRWDGPGHQFLYEEEPGRWTMFYHARDNDDPAERRYRILLSDPVDWRPDAWPSVSNGYPGERDARK